MFAKQLTPNQELAKIKKGFKLLRNNNGNSNKSLTARRSLKPSNASDSSRAQANTRATPTLPSEWCSLCLSGARGKGHLWWVFNRANTRLLLSLLLPLPSTATKKKHNKNV
jgi:hypothetical protein